MGRRALTLKEKIIKKVPKALTYMDEVLSGRNRKQGSEQATKIAKWILELGMKEDIGKREVSNGIEGLFTEDK